MLVGSVVSFRQDHITVLPEMVRPPITGKHASNTVTDVNVSLTISKMRIINLKSMEVQYEVSLHQRWIDSRLSSDDNSRRFAVSGAIWRPKLAFSSGRATPDFDDSSQFWRSWGTGNVLYSERYTLFTECSTNFQLFPFDKQRCLIKISSYRFPMDEVALKWHSKSAVEVVVSRDLISFQLTDSFTFTEVEKRPSGNFTVLVVELLLSRNPEHILIFGVLASLILVFISYLALWISVEACSARVLLPLASTLAMFEVHRKMTLDVPQTSYIKPADTWIILCSFYSFLPLIQTTVVGAITRQSQKVNFLR
ncbi:hypothetical protein B566_EDAN002352 [Ephemera danica]|nr:hypothetical protein B566_EDAN002352 [Ephemera danica]